jgi:hypothetical protein
MVAIKGFNPESGEWNDSLTGDFIWNNANIGEALSLVVTTFTWSLVGGLYELMDVLPGYHSAGNIGGRPYQNATMMFVMLTAMRKNPMELARELGNGGELPEGFTIPIPKLGRSANWTILRNSIRLGLRMNAAWQRCPKFVVESPVWCRKMRARLKAVQTNVELLSLWKEILLDFVLPAPRRCGDRCRSTAFTCRHCRPRIRCPGGRRLWKRHPGFQNRHRVLVDGSNGKVTRIHRP